MQKIPSPHRQTGITLMEALVAIVVTALGVLGILGSQLRTLADTQTSVHRAQAIRLIEDLSERMRANPNARLAYPVGGSTNNLYWISDWDQMPPAVSANYCSGANRCDLAQLAIYDMQQWKKSVSALLPQGAAKTALLNADASDDREKNQLMVLIAWRENEKEDGDDYKNAINYIADTGEACPSGKTCHVQYIPVATRCYGPNEAGLACP